MITKEELQNLLTTTETYRVERTISTTDKEKFGEAVCAFANDMPDTGKPGYLLAAVLHEFVPQASDLVIDPVGAHPHAKSATRRRIALRFLPKGPFFLLLHELAHCLVRAERALRIELGTPGRALLHELYALNPG